jgi:hypothetical protein
MDSDLWELMERSEIPKDLMAFMGFFEARNGRIALFGDVAYTWFGSRPHRAVLTLLCARLRIVTRKRDNKMSDCRSSSLLVKSIAFVLLLIALPSVARAAIHMEFGYVRRPAHR